MLSKMLRGEKIVAAGVTGSSGKSHLPRHGGIGSLILHGAGRAVRRLPSTHTTRRHLDVATERAFAWFVFAGNRIHMIGEKFLCGRDVNLSLIFLDKLFPALVAGVFTPTRNFLISICVFCGALSAFMEEF